MNRRKFLRNAGLAAGAAPMMLNGVPVRVLTSHLPLQRLAALADNDRVLIILQLGGGNDGLNTFIPLEAYDQYYQRRPNIAIPYKVGNRTAIPLDSTVPSVDQVGLHPDMLDFKYMYDVGKAAVFQGVSYENNNGSHFRGTDIWFMGGGADDYYSSGWIGRYLSKEIEPLQYPQDFGQDPDEDPLAIEIGNEVSLLFHQEGNIPLSISIPGAGPESVETLINGLPEGFDDNLGVDLKGFPPEFLNDSPYGQEMNWILGLEDKTREYFSTLADKARAGGSTTVDYPDNYPFLPGRRNSLANQFRLVAQLLAGGVKTKVFLLKTGGYDTHAEQAESYDPTLGFHSYLLWTLSSTLRAFNRDLISRGLSERVLTITMSEFGRRVASNGSYGTDHGTGGPVMMFGAGVNPGIYGTNPDTTLNNVALQFDYRQILANVLHDWMQVDKEVIANDIFFRDFIDGPNPQGGNYEPMELIKEVITGQDKYSTKFYNISKIYPNPARNYTQIEVVLNDYQEVIFQMIDMKGMVLSSFRRTLRPGKSTVSLVLDQFPAGTYFIKAKSEKLNATQKLIVSK